MPRLGPEGPEGKQGRARLAGLPGLRGHKGEEGETGETPAYVWRWRLLTVWIVVFTLIVAFAVGKNRQLGEQGEQAHEALCVFKLDLEHRVETTRELLRTNPGGLAGIPAPVLRSSIRNQQATIDSLNNLDCQPPPEETNP